MNATTTTVTITGENLIGENRRDQPEVSLGRTPLTIDGTSLMSQGGDYPPANAVPNGLSVLSRRLPIVGSPPSDVLALHLNIGRYDSSTQQPGDTLPGTMYVYGVGIEYNAAAP